MPKPNVVANNSRRLRSASHPLTRLHTAIIADSYKDFLNLITDAGHRDLLDKQNLSGSTALHIAVRAKRFKMIRALLICGADPGIFNKHGETAFHVACREGEPRNLEMLTAPVQRSELDELKRAAKNRRVEGLVDEGKLWSHNAPTKHGVPGLHIAVRVGKTQILKYLQKSGVDFNERSRKKGNTALHIAVAENKKACFEFLLAQKNIDVDLKTNIGITPYQMASCLERDYFMRRLLEAGATEQLPPPNMTRDEVMGVVQRYELDFEMQISLNGPTHFGSMADLSALASAFSKAGYTISGASVTLADDSDNAPDASDYVPNANSAITYTAITLPDIVISDEGRIDVSKAGIIVHSAGNHLADAKIAVSGVTVKDVTNADHAVNVF